MRSCVLVGLLGGVNSLSAADRLNDVSVKVLPSPPSQNPMTPSLVTQLSTCLLSLDTLIFTQSRFSPASDLVDLPVETPGMIASADSPERSAGALKIWVKAATLPLPPVPLSKHVVLPLEPSGEHTIVLVPSLIITLPPCS